MSPLKKGKTSCHKTVPEQPKMERQTLGRQQVHSRTLKAVVVQLMN